LDVGEPGRSQVRLRVEAIGLNRSEAMFRAGNYPVLPKVWATTSLSVQRRAVLGSRPYN
jgi:NADPH:quinone reductase-like Zn-dependent oxidoreductase